MPLFFPSNPIAGQQTTQNGRVYEWTGAAWEFAASVAEHKSTHATGGADALTPGDIGAASSSHTHAGEAIISGTVADERLSTNVQSAAYLFLWSNFR